MFNLLLNHLLIIIFIGWDAEMLSAFFLIKTNQKRPWAAETELAGYSMYYEHQRPDWVLIASLSLHNIRLKIAPHWASRINLSCIARHNISGGLLERRTHGFPSLASSRGTTFLIAELCFVAPACLITFGHRRGHQNQKQFDCLLHASQPHHGTIMIA